jgi:hypothetical protein
MLPVEVTVMVELLSDAGPVMAFMITTSVILI